MNMAVATGLPNIELTDKNYESWKLQTKNLLIRSNLWSYVDGSEVKTEANQLDWTRNDAKAWAIIYLNISQNQQNHVKKAVTSKEAWDTLKDIYESRGPIRKATLCKQLYRMKKEPDISMTRYISDFISKAEQLEESGIKIPNDFLSTMLLNSLPTEYENFSIAIESRDEIPTLDNLKAKLVEEEARIHDRNSRTKQKTKDAKKRAGSKNSWLYRIGGYRRALPLSPELAAIVGAEKMARSEVVKKVWRIIKERNLYDPNNEQYAICDDELMKVIGVKRFRVFGVMKYLKNHFVD